MDDFNPSYNYLKVNVLNDFKVWCQKVLPTVYDDSLSFYELLNKVVQHLNETMDTVNELGEDMNELNKAYQQLVSYTNQFKEYIETEFAQYQEEMNQSFADYKEEVGNELDTRFAEQDAKFQKLTEDYTNFKAQVEYLNQEQERMIQRYLYVDMPNAMEQKLNDYTNSTEFVDLVNGQAEAIIGEGVSSDVTEINNKLGTSTNEQTVFQDLENLQNSIDNINIDGVSDINEKIGDTADTQASSSAGTVMGKLNLLINSGGGGGGTGGSDAQIQSIIDNIGGTSDTITGTSSPLSSGTIFAKENYLIDELGTRNDQSVVENDNNFDNSSLFAKINGCFNKLMALNFYTVSGITTIPDNQSTATSDAPIGAKINYLISKWGDTLNAGVNRLVSDWTTARAQMIDTINTNAARLTAARATKIDNIGSSQDVGGTTTGGTVMAKLNTLLTNSSTGGTGWGNGKSFNKNVKWTIGTGVTKEQAVSGCGYAQVFVKTLETSRNYISNITVDGQSLEIIYGEILASYSGVFTYYFNNSFAITTNTVENNENSNVTNDAFNGTVYIFYNEN